MNKFTAAAVLVAVAVTIVTPVGFDVNTPSVNRPTVLADGSGSPVPPMPVLLEAGRAAANHGSSARS
jgi:hypothetical protein